MRNGYQPTASALSTNPPQGGSGTIPVLKVKKTRAQKIFKIDKPIRENLEITIVSHAADAGFNPLITLEIRYLNIRTPRSAEQIFRLMEKISATAAAQDVLLEVTLQSCKDSASIALKHALGVLTTSHIWRQVILPVCNLNPDHHQFGSNIVVPAEPNWDTSRGPE